jgi:hypothetical protein
MIYLWIALGVLFLGASYAFVQHRRQARQASNMFAGCTTNENCRSNEKCLDNQCVPKEKERCQVSLGALRSCSLVDPQSCDACINDPAFKCVAVQYGNPVIDRAGRNYQKDQVYTAVFLNADNTEDATRTITVSVSAVSDASNGFVQSVTITQMPDRFAKSDRFVIKGGNNEAILRLTTDPAPYIWKQGNTVVNVPESGPGMGWCLPPVTRTIACNPYTSVPILTQETDAAGKTTYVWGCNCKQPGFMQHEDSAISNCSQLVGCGGYDLYIPPKTSAAQTCTTNAQCAADARCCNADKCLKGTETFGTGESGSCYTRWGTGQTLQEGNPTKGTCDCPTGMFYGNTVMNDYVSKTCSTDPCFPNGTRTGTVSPAVCACKPGFVTCSVTSGTATVTDASCASRGATNKCIPNPCAPGTPVPGGGCTCPTGYSSVRDPNTVGGFKCCLPIPGGTACKIPCSSPNPCALNKMCVPNGAEETCVDSTEGQTCRASFTNARYIAVIKNNGMQTGLSQEGLASHSCATGTGKDLVCDPNSSRCKPAANVTLCNASGTCKTVPNWKADTTTPNSVLNQYGIPQDSNLNSQFVTRLDWGSW